MKKLKIAMTIACLLGFCALPYLAEADTDQVSATVSVTIPSIISINLNRDANSVTRGSATNIVLDKLDSEDYPDGSPGYMYAPYRSEAGKNWHIAEIIANGSSMTLSINVTGNIGGQPLADLFNLWCGGFFTPGSSEPIGGTASTDWEYAQGWQRSLSQSFLGVVPFNYQIDVSSVPAGGPYRGVITFTLTGS